MNVSINILYNEFQEKVQHQLLNDGKVVKILEEDFENKDDDLSYISKVEICEDYILLTYYEDFLDTDCYAMYTFEGENIISNVLSCFRIKPESTIFIIQTYGRYKDSEENLFQNAGVIDISGGNYIIDPIQDATIDYQEETGLFFSEDDYGKEYYLGSEKLFYEEDIVLRDVSENIVAQRNGVTSIYHRYFKEATGFGNYFPLYSYGPDGVSINHLYVAKADTFYLKSLANNELNVEIKCDVLILESFYECISDHKEKHLRFILVETNGVRELKCIQEMNGAFTLVTLMSDVVYYKVIENTSDEVFLIWLKKDGKVLSKRIVNLEINDANIFNNGFTEEGPLTKIMNKIYVCDFYNGKCIINNSLYPQPLIALNNFEVEIVENENSPVGIITSNHKTKEFDFYDNFFLYNFLNEYSTFSKSSIHSDNSKVEVLEKLNALTYNTRSVR